LRYGRGVGANKFQFTDLSISTENSWVNTFSFGRAAELRSSHQARDGDYQTEKEKGKIMESDNHNNQSDTERVEQFKRRLATALKRILMEMADETIEEEMNREKSNDFSQKRG
jgi:hypothetical protein